MARITKNKKSLEGKYDINHFYTLDHYSDEFEGWSIMFISRQIFTCMNIVWK